MVLMLSWGKATQGAATDFEWRSGRRGVLPPGILPRRLQRAGWPAVRVTVEGQVRGRNLTKVDTENELTAPLAIFMKLSDSLADMKKIPARQFQKQFGKVTNNFKPKIFWSVCNTRRHRAVRLQGVKECGFGASICLKASSN